MESITTQIDRLAVEIDGAEYEVAEKTLDAAQKLAAARDRCMNRPEYALWIAELEILLGKSAVKELFRAGRNENLDRMERIHAGVIRAFEHNHDRLAEEQAARSADALAQALAPLNELMRRLSAMERENHAIHRK